MEAVSQTDLRALDVLGYQLAGPPLPATPTPGEPPSTSTLVLEDQAFQWSASQNTYIKDANPLSPYIELYASGATHAPSLTNSGTVTLESDDTYGVGPAIGGEGSGSPQVIGTFAIDNTATGAIYVLTILSQTPTIGMLLGDTDVTNSGLIQVVSDQADAWGIEGPLAFGNSFTNTSTGVLSVSAVGFAEGALDIPVNIKA